MNFSEYSNWCCLLEFFHTLERPKLANPNCLSSWTCDTGQPRVGLCPIILVIHLTCYSAGSVHRFYKGIVPLWCRQIPYTMMKFACFERTVEALYKFVVPKPRSQCSKPEQLVVTFIAGYIGRFTSALNHHSVCLSQCNQINLCLDLLLVVSMRTWNKQLRIGRTLSRLIWHVALRDKYKCCTFTNLLNCLFWVMS